MNHLKRYQELREAQKSLNNKLLGYAPQTNKKLSPNKAAKALGYRIQDGAIVFPNEMAMDRLFDYMLYEPAPGGKSWAQRFLESGPDLPPDEAAVLRAAAKPESSLFKVVGVNRVACQLTLRDLLRDVPDVRLTDIGMASTFALNRLLFTRIFVADGITFSSGAGIAFAEDQEAFVLKRCKRLQKIKNPAIRSRKTFALFVELEKHSTIEMRLQ